jgi:pimeloyl-ACP methyl ester carboxylesterase
VARPTTAQNGVADLHALLTAANEPGPYVLVGASWGGLIARLYASTYPDQVAGLILVDGASEFFQETLTPEQWADWMQLIRKSKSADNEVPDYEPSVTQIRNVPLARIIPSVVLTSDKPWDLQVGTTGSSFPAWLTAQDRLAAQLKARHITQTNSSHGICRRAAPNGCECYS